MRRTRREPVGLGAGNGRGALRASGWLCLRTLLLGLFLRALLHLGDDLVCRHDYVGLARLLLTFACLLILEEIAPYGFWPNPRSSA